MNARLKGRTGSVRAPEEGVVLCRGEAEHLRAALEQMDLLLATRQTDAGLHYLVDLLCHLRFLKRSVA